MKKSKVLQPRSIRFDPKKLKLAKKLNVIDILSDKCREALDILIQNELDKKELKNENVL